MPERAVGLAKEKTEATLACTTEGGKDKMWAEVMKMVCQGQRLAVTIAKDSDLSAASVPATPTSSTTSSRIRCKRIKYTSLYAGMEHQHAVVLAKVLEMKQI